MWIDSHCHLEDDTAPDDVAAAAAEGVTRMVTVGVDIVSTEAAIALARRFPEHVRATAGVHPNDSSGYDAAVSADLERLAGDPLVVGIGEAGFDHYRKGATPEEQERSFRDQIALAKRLAKTLVVHTRDAHEDTRRVLDDVGPPPKLMMHCFSGDAEDARRYLDLGAVLSFAGTVTFTNAPGIQAAARYCPLDRMLVETDSPYLSPHPFRGQRNAPARIPVIGAFVAELKGVPVEEVASAVGATAARLWGSW